MWEYEMKTANVVIPENRQVFVYTKNRGRMYVNLVIGWDVGAEGLPVPICVGSHDELSNTYAIVMDDQDGLFHWQAPKRGLSGKDYPSMLAQVFDL